MRSDTPGLWSPSSDDMAGLTPPKVRDLMVRCFIEVHGETIARAKGRVGRPSGPDDIRHTVESTVRAAFAQRGFDYDKPDRGSLALVVRDLARQAEAIGAPPDVIARHSQIIGDLLERCADA